MEVLNQEKIGKFIAQCRREKGMTQKELSQKMGVTDRAVSKWENGRSLPDCSIMPSLCKELGISINELFAGERISEEEYKKTMEDALLCIAKQEEMGNRRLLRLEYVLLWICLFSFAVFLFAGCVLLQRGSMEILGGVLLIAGVFVLLTGVRVALMIEQKAGYYECPFCGRRYVPTMRSMITSVHRGQDRYMRCPYCGRRGLNKKRPGK